jgi:hypothetical protein
MFSKVNVPTAAPTDYIDILAIESGLNHDYRIYIQARDVESYRRDKEDIKQQLLREIRKGMHINNN